MEPSLLALVVITFIAAFVNGALGYGFSSMTVPVGLLFLSSRILNPALVLIEVFINLYVLFINRASIPAVWKRVLPILIGLAPGIALGSYVLASIHPGWLKFVTYGLLLPLLLVQAGGLRYPIKAEKLVGVPFGAGLGFLYSVTTISGPPLALLFNNQGYVKRDFRAGLAVIRTVESTLTAIVYYHLGMFTVQSLGLVETILLGVLVGIPLGAFAIRKSFDVWIVGFGLSKVLIDLKLAQGAGAYSVMLAAVLIDAWLLYTFFAKNVSLRRNRPAAG
jgi:uncharacterized membrane protein YfcA